MNSKFSGISEDEIFAAAMSGLEDETYVELTEEKNSFAAHIPEDSRDYNETADIVSEISKKHICNNCGREIDPDSAFCEFCGNKISSNAANIPNSISQKNTDIGAQVTGLLNKLISFVLKNKKLCMIITAVLILIILVIVLVCNLHRCDGCGRVFSGQGYCSWIGILCKRCARGDWF